MLKDYKVLSGEDIYSVAYKLYGDISYAVKLTIDNSIGLNDSLDGLTLTYDDSIKSEVLQPLLIAPIKQNNVAQTYNSYFGQSIFDVVLNLTGSLENVVSVVKNSNMTNINNILNKTYVFTYNTTQDPLVLWANNRGIIYNTGIQLEQQKLGEFDESFDQQAFS
jgi:hypothetical protein